MFIPQNYSSELGGQALKQAPQRDDKGIEPQEAFEQRSQTHDLIYLSVCLFRVVLFWTQELDSMILVGSFQLGYSMILCAISTYLFTNTLKSR